MYTKKKRKLYISKSLYRWTEAHQHQTISKGSKQTQASKKKRCLHILISLKWFVN